MLRLEFENIESQKFWVSETSADHVDQASSWSKATVNMVKLCV